MKRKTFLSTMAVCLALALLYRPKEDVSSKPTKAKPLQTASADLLFSKNLQTLNPYETQAPQSLKRTQFKAAYRKAAAELAQKIEELNLNGEDLSELFNSLGEKKFLSQVPNALRPYYEKLNASIYHLQDHYLAQDGVSRAFFTQYRVEMPEELKEKRAALEKVDLPLKVEDVVKIKMNEKSLSEADVKTILDECGRGESDCINKAFALLIDINHALNDHQLEMIKEYL